MIKAGVLTCELGNPLPDGYQRGHKLVINDEEYTILTISGDRKLIRLAGPVGAVVGVYENGNGASVHS